jgi:hypothetical protein
MNDALLNSALNFLQQVIAINPTAKATLLQAINQPQLSSIEVQPGGNIQPRQNKSMKQLLAQKKWTAADRTQAADYVKLPTGLKNFLTQKNML